MSSYTIHGHVSNGFERVRQQFEQNFANGLEKNAQLCVYLGEERIIDLWGSMNDSKEYDGDTFTNVFSSTKSLSAICIATLVNKKLLDYSDKVVKHWPEYGNGDKEKEAITVADILRHEGGMPQLSKTLRLADILREHIKNNSIGSIIEKEPLRFPPPSSKTKAEYHAITRGWILNEIFRRVDPEQRTIGECLRDDIATPLDVDCYIGLTFEQLEKSFGLSALTLSQVMRKGMVPKFLGRKTDVGIIDIMKVMAMFAGKNMQRPLEHMTDDGLISSFENSIVRLGEVPSANGQCSARGLARVAAMMANKGTIDGIEIISEETWNSVHSGQEETKPMYPFGMESNFSQGGVNRFSAIKNISNDCIKVSSANREGYIGWMGFGGSVLQWYPDYKIGFGYVPTLLAWEDMGNGKAALFQKIVLDCVKEMQE